MDEALLVDIVLFCLAAFAFVYTLAHFVSAPKRPFYVFMFLGLVAFFVARFFNLVFELCGGDSYLFTLGDLGSSGGYLFFTYATLSLRQTSPAPAPRARHPAAFVPPAVIVLCWVVMAVSHLEWQKMVVATILLSSAVPCSYICADSIAAYKGTNGSGPAAFRPLWGVIMLWNIINMASEATWVIQNEALSTAAMVALLLTADFIYLALPILLQRGNKKCTV